MLFSIKNLPFMIFVLFLFQAFARQIMIPQRSKFAFADYGQEDSLYKLMYRTRNDIEISIFDPEDRLIAKTSSKGGALYANVVNQGKIKIVVENLSNEVCAFSYKCPDPSKERIGRLGYIKDTDLVSELANLFDELIQGQKTLIQRTVEHQAMVARSKTWARFLMIFEFLLTGIAVYVIHKDFIAIFENKQTL